MKKSTLQQGGRVCNGKNMSLRVQSHVGVLSVPRRGGLWVAVGFRGCPKSRPYDATRLSCCESR